MHHSEASPQNVTAVQPQVVTGLKSREEYCIIDGRRYTCGRQYRRHESPTVWIFAAVRVTTVGMLNAHLLMEDVHFRYRFAVRVTYQVLTRWEHILEVQTKVRHKCRPERHNITK